MIASEPLGKVYTPEKVARALFDRAVHWIPSPRERLRVLDPAVGDGELLLPAIRWAAERDVPLDVFAVDVDRHACEALPARLRPALCGQSTLTVLNGDALELALRRPWGYVDLVIANPPYVRETGHRELFRRIRNGYDGVYASLYRKDCDLHHFFWSIAMDALGDTGCLAFLTPAYFLESRSAAPLRRDLATRGTVRSIWRAGAEQVFPDAGVEAAMTVWTAGPSRDLTELTDSRTDRRTARVPADGSEWWMAPEPRIEGASQTIGALFDVSEGVSTAANRLRASSVELVDDGTPGEGIFLLRAHELR